MERIAALLIELPQREIGGVLPSWQGLTEICQWARSQGIALQMDGARLWECGPFYGRPYREIAGLFDSVYVSFYKGLGGMAGAMLLGDEDFVQEARTWLRRHGGEVVTLFPFVLSAEQGLDARLEKMGVYVAKAREVAELLGQFPGVEIRPNPPHTNMMHLRFPLPKEVFDRRDLEIAKKHQIKLFGPSEAAYGNSTESQIGNPAQEPGCEIEISIGDCALEMSRAQIQELFGEFFEGIESSGSK